MADSSGYDPKRSRVSDDKMNEFLRGQLTGDLTEVPGIGPAAVKKLAMGDLDDDKVTNTFQLIGKVSTFVESVNQLVSILDFNLNFLAKYYISKIKHMFSSSLSLCGL